MSEEQPKTMEVVRQQPRDLSVDAQENIDGLRAVQYAAKLMAKSGCFADIKGVDEETAIAKAVVKIAIGRDYGFSCAESMQYIELIQGRPSIGAHARAAKMKAAGYSWKFVKFDATICSLIVYGPKGDQLGDTVFTIEDAKRMQLAGKDNWIKNPRNMLYCRAISNAQRWYAPEVLSAALASKEDVLDGDYGPHTPQVPPDGDPAWLQVGSTAAARNIAEEKIAALQAQQESPAERDARIARQIEEQTEATRAKAASGSPAMQYTEDTLPDAFDVKTGTECLLCAQDGRILRLRAVEENGEAPTWKTVEEAVEQPKAQPPQPAQPAAQTTTQAPAPRQRPVFGRGK